MDLWLLNTFWGRLTNGALDSEVEALEEAKEKLIEYNKLHQFMSYCSDLCERATLLMNREETVNPIIPLNFYRGSSHNKIENLYPEIESLLEAYYDLIESVADNPDWKYKVETECGSHIAFLATSIDETSRDYLVENSAPFRQFDLDKQRFFK